MKGKKYNTTLKKKPEIYKFKVKVSRVLTYEVPVATKFPSEDMAKHIAKSMVLNWSLDQLYPYCLLDGVEVLEVK